MIHAGNIYLDIKLNLLIQRGLCMEFGASRQCLVSLNFAVIARRVLIFVGMAPFSIFRAPIS